MKNADILWQQGQPFSCEFDDIYFSREDGLAETEYVFMQQNDLPGRWQGVERFVIAETGFGTGLNFLITVQHWLQQAEPKSCLHYLSIEKFPLSRADLEQALSQWPELADLSKALLDNYPPALKGLHHIPLFENRVVLSLVFGDVSAVLPDLHACVDAWYLDGFAPGKNPSMWTTEVFKGIASLSKVGTSFSTFTAAGVVRRGMQEAGFKVERVKGFGKKREMLRGVLIEELETNTQAPWFSLPKAKPRRQQRKHAVVVGAGIAGISTAWSLSKRGWHVDVVEQGGNVAHGGSGNPLGIVMPRLGLVDNAESEFYRTAFFKSLRELEYLKHQYAELNWQQGGVLQLASSERIRKQIEKLDCPPELARTVTAEQASEIAGVDIATKALYFPHAGWIDPVQLCQVLLVDAGCRVNLHPNTTITVIEYEEEAWQLLDEHGVQVMESGVVVLANASSVNRFSQSDFIPVQPARGQISLISANTGSKRLRCAVCHDGYILPETSGQHVIGASFVPGDENVETRGDEDRKNILQLQKALPALFAETIMVTNSRAALRATTADRLPLVGPVADKTFFTKHYNDLHKGKLSHKYPAADYCPGLYVNSGHGARGLTSAFLSAEIIASQLNDDPLAVTKTLQQSLLASRFMIRDFRRKTAD